MLSQSSLCILKSGLPVGKMGVSLHDPPFDAMLLFFQLGLVQMVRTLRHQYHHLSLRKIRQLSVLQ